MYNDYLSETSVTGAKISVTKKATLLKYNYSHADESRGNDIFQI